MAKKSAPATDDADDLLGDAAPAPAKKAKPAAKKPATKTAAKGNGKAKPAAAPEPKAKPKKAAPKKAPATRSSPSEVSEPIRAYFAKIKKPMTYAAIAEKLDVNIRAVRRLAREARDNGELTLEREGAIVMVSAA